MTRALWRYGLSLLVLIVGIVGALFMYGVSRDADEVQTRTRFETSVEEISALLRVHMRDSMRAVETIGAFFDASQNVTADEFELFVTYFLQDHDAFRAVMWVSTPEEEEGKQFPIRYVVPVSRQGLLGLDLAHMPVGGAVFEEAEEARHAVLSHLFVPELYPELGPVVVIVQPVFRGGPEGKGDEVVGFVVGSVSIGALVEGSLEAGEEREVRLSITETTLPLPTGYRVGEEFQFVSTSEEGDGELSFSSTFPVGNREWQVDATPLSGAYHTPVSPRSSFVLWGGLVSAVIMAGILWLAVAHAEVLRKAKDAAEYASRVRGIFLSRFGHELRTPLHTVLGYSEMVEEGLGTEPPETLREDMMKVTASARLLNVMLGNIFDLSRIEVGDLSIVPEKFEVEGLIEEIEGVMRPVVVEHGNRITVEVEGLLGEAEQDRPKVMRVIVNLLDNATRLTKKGAVSLSVKGSEKMLTFVVESTGEGLPKEIAQLAIEGLFPLNDIETNVTFRGTRIALFLCGAYVRAMEGTIKLDQSEKGGRCYVVELPRHLNG